MKLTEKFRARSEILGKQLFTGEHYCLPSTLLQHKQLVAMRLPTTITVKTLIRGVDVI